MRFAKAETLACGAIQISQVRSLKFHGANRIVAAITGSDSATKPALCAHKHFKPLHAGALSLTALRQAHRSTIF
jgi:hypothetical protein